jgi:hypothetical protein
MSRNRYALLENLIWMMCSSWAFHVDDRSESSSTDDMIIVQGIDHLG